MQENQNIEWKESWRDEYIKWICGFANATGGKLLIGVNDKGVVTGLTDAKKLMEEIPNKIRDILGIIVDVNLKTKKGLSFLEISVDAYPYPISYKGEYQYRTGSTKQVLKGAALDRFLLQRLGKRWDGVPVPNVTVSNLSKVTFDYFRKNAAESKRLDKAALEDTNSLLLEKLHLTDGKYLKRAAVLLFHPDPEKFVTGAYVKIGYFKTDTDLLFQDDIHGDLFAQVEKTMDLLLTKYLKASISYKLINRVEDYPFPEAALREALLNAIAHKDYSSGNPIQISVYHNKIIFWNEGQLPDDWTVKTLLKKHPSIPFNPDISNTFFRAGLIEAWGRGTLKILDECRKAKLPVPLFKYDLSGFVIELKAIPPKVLQVPSPELKELFELIAKDLMHERVLTEKEIEKCRTVTEKLESNSFKIIELLEKNGAMKRKDILLEVGLANHTDNARKYLEPLLKLTIVSPSIKDKPNSQFQKYFLTSLGKKVAAWIKHHQSS